MDMDRRAFFKSLGNKATRSAVQHLDKRARKHAGHWIRPPYALPELEFLLACSRCGACTEACPHQVVFPLGGHLGPEVVGTPALDLLNRGCQLCNDWPCVQACETGALVRPLADDEQEPAAPRLAMAAIDTAACLPYNGPECGACADACPVEGALRWQGEKPVIDSAQCTGCALCRAACILEPKAISIRSLHAVAAAE